MIKWGAPATFDPQWLVSHKLIHVDQRPSGRRNNDEVIFGPGFSFMRVLDQYLNLVQY
jgi:hypothetical protein